MIQLCVIRHVVNSGKRGGEGVKEGERTSSRYSITALKVFFPLAIAAFRASGSIGATETVVVSQMVA